MQILQFQTKGLHLNIIQHFYICKEASINNNLSVGDTIPNNKIFETIYKEFKGTSH